jgi:exodeoxyribonuclease VII large subunit
LARSRQGLAHTASRLAAAGERLVARRHQRLAELHLRLARARPNLDLRRTRLERAAAGLAALNPQAALARGYALVRTPDGQLVRSHHQLAAGMALNLRFAEGGAEALVSKIIPD